MKIRCTDFMFFYQVFLPNVANKKARIAQVVNINYMR